MGSWPLLDSGLVAVCCLDYAFLAVSGLDSSSWRFLGWVLVFWRLIVGCWRLLGWILGFWRVLA